MTKTFFSIVILTSLCMAQSPSRPAPLPQIQSPSLRIEFDKQMRSRVVARFNGKEVPLGAFSASETLRGSERAWYNFALESQKQEHVNDVYGGGEKLTLVAEDSRMEQQ
jgi:alpha-galactosidase